jgi:hypothetical protein
MADVSGSAANRAGRGAGDMLRSVGVVLVFVAAIWLLGQLTRPQPPAPVTTGNYTSAVKAARRDAPYPVLAPNPVPRGWQVTRVSATGSPNRFGWQLGFETATGQYVALQQSNAASPADFVRRQTPGSSPVGRVRINGTDWQRRLASGTGDRSLVRVSQGVATVLTSTTGYDVLVALASSLR